MRTFVILLSCLVCCATAGHYGLAQKVFGLQNVGKEQGYAPVGTDQRQRQEFLLDVLLQVQKPLVNNQLVQLGQELVTDSNMYLSPNDEILQQFLQQAENREIIGRNGVYNPVDISNIRQLVGLQRYFVLARDFNVFQRNVVYARLYFNPVMFVDALSLAIRDRPDTQDLMLPPLNEILPHLYYDNYVLSYAQNVDYDSLISQQARANIKPSIFDIFGLHSIGSLFQLSKYGLYHPLQQRYGAHRYGIGRFGISSEGRRVNSKENGGEYLVDSSYIQEKFVVPVEEKDATDLTNDIGLNVAWNNIIIDQLVQAVTEGIQGGQQSGIIGDDQQQYQELKDEQTYDYGGGYGESYQDQNNKQYIYERQSRGINSNGLPQVDVSNPRLLYVGRRHRGGYSAYVNPFYRQLNQNGYDDQQYDSAYYYSNGPQQSQGAKYIYGDQSYPYARQQYQRTQYGYTDPEYSYDRQQNQGTKYGYQGSQYGYKDNEYTYGRQQNQGSQYGYNSYGQQNQGSQYGYVSYDQQNQGAQYGYKDNEYSYGRQQNQESKYGYKDNEYLYGRQQNQGSQYGYGSYGPQNQGAQYGYATYDQQNQRARYGYKDNEYSYGREQNQGSQYGYGSYGQKNQGSQYGYGTYGPQNQGAQYGYATYDQQNQGARYGYKHNEYSYGRQQNHGSQYGYGTYGPQNQGAQYGYKDNEYSYGRQQNQGSQYGYGSYDQKNQGSQYGYGTYGPQNQEAQYGYKDNEYSYGRQQNQGSQYGYKDNGYTYGSYYGTPYDRQQYQGSQYGYKDQQYYYGGQQNQGAKYSYNYPVYSSSYYNPYASQQYYYKNYEYQYEPRSQQQDQYQNQGAQYSYNYPVYSSSYYNPYASQQYYYKNYEYQYEPRSQQQDQYQRQQQQFQYGPIKAYAGDDVVLPEREVRDTRYSGQGGKRYRSYEGKRVSYRNTEQYRELEGLREGIVGSIESTQQLRYSRRGEILLQSIQELAARLNIQRIVETLEGRIYQQQQQDNQIVQQEVEQIIRQIRTLVEQVREETGISEGSDRTLYILADVIGGRIVLEQQQQVSIGVQRTLQELQQQIQRFLGYQVGQVNELTPLALLYGSLRSPATQQTILSLAQLIDDYRQQLEPYTSSQLSGNGDISVQNVQIEPLVTYTEAVDIDLVNLIDQQLLQSNANNLQQLGQKVVARQQRLNYEPFTISVDIESQRQQEVAIRILLAPQIDHNGRRISLAQNRNNFILIDAYVQQLQAGINNIQRNSRQFNGYSGEVSTISQIYRQIMTGQKQQQQQYGITRQLPKHLLLPRGSAVNGGLPVQILVVATPLNEQAGFLRLEDVNAQQLSGLGIAAVGVDQLPLYYPLDRQIIDEQRLDVPNIRLTETVIQYNSRRDA